jgi:LuxR family quorum sensing-dependent transcriptional regulator
MAYREALAFVERLDQLPSTDAVMDAMQRALDPFGFEFVSLFTFPRPGQRFEDVRIARRVPSEWSKIYLEKQYVHVSPAVRHCRRTVRPFAWKTAPYDSEQEPRVAELMNVMAEFGLLNSISVPIPGPTGCEGVAWLGGKRQELTAYNMPLIHLMALYAFERIRSFTKQMPSAKPNVTLREREVLTWVALGKSAWEIGEILGIAKRTVDEHTQTAMKKLGAVNRAQAVAVALRNRLIEP